MLLQNRKPVSSSPSYFGWRLHLLSFPFEFYWTAIHWIVLLFRQGHNCYFSASNSAQEAIFGKSFPPRNSSRSGFYPSAMLGFRCLLSFCRLPSSFVQNLRPHKIPRPVFHQLFATSTQQCGYSHAENLSRLQRSLQGRARDAVASLLAVPENVPEILQTLEFRFGRSDLDAFVAFATEVKHMVVTMTLLHATGHMTNPQLRNDLCHGHCGTESDDTIGKSVSIGDL